MLLRSSSDFRQRACSKLRRRSWPQISTMYGPTSCLALADPKTLSQVHSVTPNW